MWFDLTGKCFSLCSILGNAFRDVKGKLYPSIGMKGPGEEIKANFGQTPFVFDIDGMMAVRNLFAFFFFFSFFDHPLS